ncbi:SRPBCC family protein [Microlunatus speluncae]|uniref:SRPBCC family protein n=1 Tax=Microlunatus speluncae TaxID=2594267 RepID=UPI0012667CF5|nr:SRPBCC domain-containing protein [Microlunatus speluncae]
MTDESATSDQSSGRYGETMIEVPGTPEEVWQAIATGAGQSGWTFAAEIEPAEGGEMIIHREPFAPTVAVVVASWDPPRSFGYAAAMPGAPSPLATEILVEARSGGSCVVRVVCGFADAGEEWEDLVDSAVEGWRMTLLVLRAYLRRFTGRPVRALDLITLIDPAPADRVAPADRLFTRLGLPGADRVAGRSFRTAAEAPELTGVVEYAGDGYLLLRAEAPHPALIAISCFSMGVDRPLSINLMGRIYGDLDDSRLDRLRARWQTWLERQADHLAADHDHPSAVR